MTEKPVGFVVESGSFNRTEGAVSLEAPLRPGSFLQVEIPHSFPALVQVKGVQFKGGIFVPKNISYYLKDPSKLGEHRQRLYQSVELNFLATIDGQGGLVSMDPVPIPAGSPIALVSSKHLSQYVASGQKQIQLGSLTTNPAVQVHLDMRRLLSNHTAVLGQTGSGKTNVLRLLHEGIRDNPGEFQYVIFDFHDEFFSSSDFKERVLHPPYRFGPGDIRFETIQDLLPGLTTAQKDLLALALDEGPPASLERFIDSVERHDAAPSTKRVLLRRLRRLLFAKTFESEKDVGDLVANLNTTPHQGTVIKLGSVQTEIARLVISSVVRQIMKRRIEGRFPPTLFIVDEAHRLMAGSETTSTTHSFRYLAQEGRKFGVTLVLATQRPSLVDQTILSQCANVIALRTSSQEDARTVSHLLNESRSEILTELGIGQGVFASVHTLCPLWVNFHYIKTQIRESEYQIGLQQSLFDY